MNYRQEGETDAELDDYDIIHYPWTAVLGLRDRKPKQQKPGIYGALIRIGHSAQQKQAPAASRAKHR